MERYTLSIIYDHRNRTEEGKEGPLEVRITIKKKAYYLNTGIRVQRNEWAGSVVNREDCDMLNNRLAAIVEQTNTELLAMQREGAAFDVKVLRGRVFGSATDEECDALLTWIEHEIPLLKVADTTRKHYDVLLNRLVQYGCIRQWSDLTTENIFSFDRWLHTIDKPQSNGDIQAEAQRVKIGDSAVYNYHKALKALLNRAVKFGMLQSNPYVRLRGEFSRGNRENVEFLTEDEITAIESLRPMPGTQVAMARDLFVFQLYTGLSYSDTQSFDINDYRLVGGQWRAIGNRIKTGVAYVSDLLPQAVEVLERYNFQAPKIGNVQYNASLKVIQQALGIRTRLHSHLARHTFATRALAMGVQLQNVSRMLGHTNTKQTERYAKVLAESVHNDFERMNKILQEKK